MNQIKVNNDLENGTYRLEEIFVNLKTTGILLKIFETKDQQQGWDGRKGGKLQPTGVYMYVCKMKTADGQEIIKKGSVNLIR